MRSGKNNLRIETLEIQPATLKQVLVPSLFIAFLGTLLAIYSGYPISISGHLGFWSLPIGAVVGGVLYGVVFWITNSAWLNTESMRALLTRLSLLFRNMSWPAICLLSVSAGVGEELLFRGVLQTWLVYFSNPFLGVLLASLIFGLMHALNLTYVVLTFILGSVFGFIYHITESLMLIVVAHTVYDLFAFAILVKFPYLLKIDMAKHLNTDQNSELEA